jgi:hypothetical protein
VVARARNWSWPPLWFEYCSARSRSPCGDRCAWRHRRSRASGAARPRAGSRRARVEDVEESALRVVGGEGHRQQAALAAVKPDDVAHVQERRSEPAPIPAHADHAILLDEEPTRVVAARRGHVGGVVEGPQADELEAGARALADGVGSVGAGMEGMGEGGGRDRGDCRQRGERGAADNCAADRGRRRRAVITGATLSSPADGTRGLSCAPPRERVAAPPRGEVEGLSTAAVTGGEWGSCGGAEAQRRVCIGAPVGGGDEGQSGGS